MAQDWLAPHALRYRYLMLTAAARCDLHGLIVGTDGRCTRCIKEEARGHTLRIYRLIGAVSGIVLFLFGLFHVVTTIRSSLIGREASSVAAVTSTAPASDAVLVYTTSSCPWCRKAKAWLDQRGVAYTERNVDQDPEAETEFKRLAGGHGVPTFVVNGTVQSGYSVAWLESTFPRKP